MGGATLHRLVGAARSLVAHGLYYSGVLGLWCRVALRHRAVVLTYHRVLPDEALARTWSHPGIIVTRETFDAHVRTLKRVFRILSLEEFVAALESADGFRTPSCLITFDDGWRDTFTEAFPVLRQHDVPATVFLPVDYIGADRMFWQEELSALMHRAWERRDDAGVRAACERSFAAHGFPSVFEASPADVRLLVRTRVNALKSGPIAVPRALIADVRAALGAAVDGLLPVDGFMTWDEVRLMRAGRTTFGGHGTTHRLLTTLPVAELEDEAARSRATIARELSEAPASFSYPNGDWNAGVADAVDRAGYRVSFSTERGIVNRGDPRLSLRRFNMHEDATARPPLLLARLVGLM
jgi:peptidoglycan/xylan/chitin deacetylase (PgdA/CDA1 family)